MNGWLARHRPEIRLSLQMTVAGLAAYAVGHLLVLSQVYWAVLTAVIVTQSSIGGSLKASFDRFFGTIGGAAWGVAVSLTVPHANALFLGAALAIALIPLAVGVALWPRYRVGAGDRGYRAARHSRLSRGGHGRARPGVRDRPRQRRRALAAMREQAVLLLGKIDGDPAAVQRLHDRIRAAVERANTIADEVVRERVSRSCRSGR